MLRVLLWMLWVLRVLLWVLLWVLPWILLLQVLLVLMAAPAKAGPAVRGGRGGAIVQAGIDECRVRTTSGRVHVLRATSMRCVEVRSGYHTRGVWKSRASWR